MKLPVSIDNIFVLKLGRHKIVKGRFVTQGRIEYCRSGNAKQIDRWPALPSAKRRMMLQNFLWNGGVLH